MGVADEKTHRRPLFGRPPAGDGEHFARGIDGCHMCAAPRQQKRRPAGAGADVENHAVANGADQAGEHAGLGGGDKIANRSTETHRIEGARRFRVRVGGVAVMISAHARSFTAWSGTGLCEVYGDPSP